MISVAIMAHPLRRRWVPGLADRIDADVRVVWDRHNDRHETGLRALKAHGPDATHHLVVQDDALVCRDLVASLTRAVKVSCDHPIALYTGTTDRDLLREARRTRRPWFRYPGPWWGVAIVLPTAHLDDLTSWYERSTVTNYDRRIAAWYETQGLDCLYTVPSLVEHRLGHENPSLVPGRNGRKRGSFRFIGENRSAMTIWWRRP